MGEGLINEKHTENTQAVDEIINSHRHELTPEEAQKILREYVIFDQNNTINDAYRSIFEIKGELDE